MLMTDALLMEPTQINIPKAQSNVIYATTKSCCVHSQKHLQRLFYLSLLSWCGLYGIYDNVPAGWTASGIEIVVLNLVMFK